jgi:hypothetical protein
VLRAYGGSQRAAASNKPIGGHDMENETLGSSLQGLIAELPPDLQNKVRDFAQFLLEKRQTRQTRPLLRGWSGSLRAYRDQYTSLELQSKALEWRGD